MYKMMKYAFPIFLYGCETHEVHLYPSFQFYNLLLLWYFALYRYCRALSSLQWHKVAWTVMDSCLTVECTEQYKHSNCYLCLNFNIQKWQNLKVMRDVPVCCIFHCALMIKKLRRTFWCTYVWLEMFISSKKFYYI